jgi:branched-chain amino acid transport system permease protein
MVILGGVGTFNGAIIGSVVYLLAEQWLSVFVENWKIIFGPILVLIVLFARGGIIGLGERLWRALHA